MIFAPKYSTMYDFCLLWWQTEGMEMKFSTHLMKININVVRR